MWESVKTRLVNHRDREAQDQIFEATIKALVTEQTVSLEGGPGTGKSLFAAVMAHAAVSRGSKLFYVPFTKSQQDMIESETIPRMAAFLPKGYAVLKGRSNYVCLTRAERAGFRHLSIVGDGTRPNYPDLRGDDWSLVCSSSDAGCDASCAGDAFQDAKARAAEATMVITNQAMLAIDYALGGKVLGALDNDYLIVDEAHLFPGVMQNALGGTISPHRLNLAWKAAQTYVEADPLAQAASCLEDALWTPGDQWTSYAVGEKIHSRVEGVVDEVGSLLDAYEQRDEKPPRELRALSWRLGSLLRDTRFLTRETDTHSVITVLRSRGSLAVEVKKFDVTAEARSLFSRFQRTVLMSATMEPLATKLLGVPEAITGPPPFDLVKNRLAYHPTWKTSDRAPHQWRESDLCELVAASKGGALVVASSKVQAQRAADALRSAGWSVGLQTGGGEDVRRLINGLKDGTFSVIVGTDSVGTGIDIPGPALRLVVILSALNPNPADTHLSLWAATVPGNAWNELFTPMLWEKTEQSAGRLLRTPTDRGVVAFLDPRGYPRSQFRSIVNPTPWTGDIAVVKEFFDAV